MRRRVFLIHGWAGRPDNHWFPWLSLELKARGFQVDSLAMPHAAHLVVAEWLKALADAVHKADANDYFVGHSLGCITIIRYLATLPRGTKVGGCVFVAGFSGRVNIPEIAEFYTPPQTAAGGQNKERTRTSAESLAAVFESAKKHCSTFVTIFSDNDDGVPLEQSLQFQKQLGAKAILEKGKGHFTTEDGVTALPPVFKSLMTMSAF